MRGFDQVTLMGNVVHIGELRTTRERKRYVTDMIIAVTKKVKTGKVTTDVPVVLWDKTAEMCVKYLKKGEPIHIAGYLQNRSVKISEDKMTHSLEVVAKTVTFLNNDIHVDMEEVGKSE